MNRLLHLFSTPRTHYRLILAVALLATTTGVKAQIGFLSQDLVTGLSSPTTLQIGPDGRLYVGQQDGTLNVYTIFRNSPGNYAVTDHEIITLVKNIPNHNDNGAFNPGQGNRQVTGLMVKGTSNNPVLYVTSSDPRIAVGGDSNLDTNSGTLSRLTWVGSDLSDPAGYWDMVHLVRGMPRSEENHATNGMSLDQANNLLYMAVGGFTNKGAPGNNFSGTPEYALSACILQIDMNVIEAMPVYTDLRNGQKFVYDIPTLDDPTRVNINNTHPDFPYAPGHPYYELDIDLGDPFGGNNGLNQGRWIVNGPVQVYAGGFRNPYDVVFTSNGRVYSHDNGPNGGWGGIPKTYDAGGNEIANSLYDHTLGHYITNEFNEGNSNQHGDRLHLVTPGYYAGMPVPVRTNPDKAPLYVYEKVGGNWIATAGSPYDFFTDFPEPPVPMSLATPHHGRHLDPNGFAIADINKSTNGICEYTASNFGGAMQGDLLVASWNQSIVRFTLNAAGDGLAPGGQANLLSNNGSNPLDVWAQGDGVEFPGTIWVAFHGANKIMVFEPNDFAPFSCTGAYDINLDEDGDGYSNADEIDNGTDPCNPGSRPSDYDGDFLSDLNDPDDDNDGLLDTYDPFSVDPNNGLTTFLPINYSFSIDNNSSIPGSLFGLGFTGLMTNGDYLTPIEGTDYQDFYDLDNLNLGGATGKLGVEEVTTGTADEVSNDQSNGFQFGLNVDVNDAPFTVVTEVESPFFLVNGFPLANPINDQSMGVFIGNGDQDNFLKLVMYANSGAGGLRVYKEEDGVGSGMTYSVSGILNVTAVTLYLEVFPHPTTSQVQPRYSLDGGITQIDLGSPINIPTAWLDPNDDFGLAIGVISTSVNSATPFDATWDYLNVISSAPVVILPLPDRQVLQGASDDVINLDNHFDDDNGTANLTYTVESNSGSFVGASIVGNQLTLQYPAANNDSAIIIIRATDAAAYFREDTFLVAVIDPLVVLYRVNAGGDGLASLDVPNKSWDIDKQGGQASPYRTDGSNLSATSFNSLDPSVPAYVPPQIFSQERWDGGAAPDMEWTFPAPKAGVYEVHLFFLNNSGGTQNPGQRVFDVELEGAVWLDNYDIVADVGHKVGVMKTGQVTVVDGFLNVDFRRVLENPLVNGIEILGPPQTDFSGELSLTPQPLHFFSTEVGTNSSPQNMTLTNTGEDPIQVTELTIGGGDASEFSLTVTLPLTLSPGQSVNVPVIFSPATVGSKLASISAVHTGVNASPQVLMLTGEAIPNGSSITVLNRVNAGGPIALPADGYGISFEEDQANGGVAGGAATSGNSSGHLISGGENTFGTDQTVTVGPSIPGSAGPAVFQTMRFDPAGGDNMVYEFAMVPGTILQIRLLFAETVFNTAGARVFDVAVNGVVPAVYDNIDVYDIAGANQALMMSYTTSITGNVLTLEFQRVAGDPMISAIELTDVGTSGSFPVTWLGLAAELVTDGVAVNWSTGNEINSDYFQVERSHDGSEFVSIGYVMAAGNSREIRHYRFLDMNPLGTRMRYRIRQVDLDGQFAYSNVIELALGGENLYVFPNPAEDLVTVMLPQTDERMNFQILDMAGRIWHREILEGSTREGKELSVGHLPDGVYVVMVNFPDGRNQQFRVIKRTH